jgi:gliding motility-associated-like protein
MKKIRFILLLMVSIITNSFSQAPATWTVTPSYYSNSMQITCKLNQNCVDLADPNNKIAAFAGSQCRGVASSNVVSGGNNLAFLVVYSNSSSGEHITFQIYNAASNTVFNVFDTISFISNGQIGGVGNPRLMTNNHPPTDMQLSAASFLESLSVGGVIGNLSATDNDVPNSFTYALPAGVLDNASYSISGNQLLTNATFDHETDSLDTIRVVVTDVSLCTYTEDFAIFINDQNDAPTDLQFAAAFVYDGNPAGTFTGKFSTIDADLFDTFTYTLVAGAGSTDNAAFYISHDSLFNVNAYTYATRNVFHFRARSTDAGGLFIEDTFVVNLINVNDAPISLDDSLSTHLPEDGSNGMLNILGNDTDADGDPSAPTNGTGQFVVDINTSIAGVQVTKTDSTGTWTYDPLTGQLTFDALNNYYGIVQLTYQLCDSSGACDMAVATFTVDPMNDPVVAADDTVITSLTEDSANGTVNIIANDTDIDEAVTAPVNGPSQFTIDIDTTTPGIQTNISTASGIWSLDTLTGLLTFNPANNFFGAASLTYTICDDSSACSNATAYFNVISVNDPPIATNDSIASALLEDGSNGVVNILSNDSDIESMPVAPTNVAGGFTVDIDTATAGVQITSSDTTGTWTYSAATGEITFDPAANFNGVVVLTYQLCDTSGACDQATVTFTVDPMNDAVVAANDSVTAHLTEDDANGTVTILSNDTDIDETVAAPVNGPSQFVIDIDNATPGTQTSFTDLTGSWQLDTLTGVLSFDPTANYFGPASLIYTICDDSSGCSNASVYFTVDAVNDAPGDILLSHDTISENLAAGAFVANLSSLDIELSDTHTYTLVSGTGSQHNTYFRIASDSLLTDSILDFEYEDTLHIRIQTTDNAAGTYEKAFSIVVIDRNDTPTDLALSADSIQEQSPVNTLVGSFTTTDQDPLNTHTYSLVSGTGDTDNALFAIAGADLHSAQVYYFTNQVYSIRVRTTDNAGAFFEKVFTVRVTNLNDPPTDILIDTLSLQEDNEADFYLGKIRTVDADSPDAFTYSLVSGSGDTDNAQFTILNDNLYINGKTNYDVQPSYSIRVRSTDLAGLFVEKAFTVEVQDIAGNTIPLPSVNYLSPNGDGKNDLFKIENIDIYKEFALSIYDQYGMQIYSIPENYQNNWDGRRNGTPLPTGNYYFIFKNDKITYKGNITIVNQN